MNTQDYFKTFSGDILFNEPLAKHTYYRIGGPADILAAPKSLEDLKIIAGFLSKEHLNAVILGSGSNVLVSDAGVRGLVIKMTRLSQAIDLLPSGNLKLGSGVAVSTLLRRCVQEGWGGLEFLTGVPGSIGGVVAMNAGTHLGEAKDRLVSVTVYDLASGEIKTIQELPFSYRKNHFLSRTQVVVETVWKIEKQDPSFVKSTIDDLLVRRKTTQPVEYPSCGSVFKNPKAFAKHAWQVIDELGLRGHRIGGAQISEKHPNFIVNLGAATAADVKGLIDLVKARALGELNIPMEEEVKYLG